MTIALDVPQPSRHWLRRSRQATGPTRRKRFTVASCLAATANGLAFDRDLFEERAQHGSS